MLSAMELFNRVHGNELSISKNAAIIFAENYHFEKQKELINNYKKENNHNHEELRKGLDHNHTFGVNLGIGF